MASRIHHRPLVRLLMALVRPFTKLKIVGKENLKSTKGQPVVYVCNHGFIYGPIAAIMNLPGTFRPWIDSRMLNHKQCSEVINTTFHNLLHRFSQRKRERVLRKTTDTVIKILNDFNPIPVVKGGSRQVMETLGQSLNALVDGCNLLIFPEHPRTAFDGNLVREHDEAGRLRSFYSGFAHIGQMYFERTKQKLLFVPIYINRKRHSMSINPPVAYESSGDSHRDRQWLSDRLYAAISTMKND